MNRSQHQSRIDVDLVDPQERCAELERLSQNLWSQSVRVRERAAEQLIELGQDALPSLCEALDASDTALRVLAAKALGKLRNRRAVDPLIGALGSRFAKVRRAAAQALGEIGDPYTEPLLRELLHDRDLHTRAAAARALGELGREASLPALLEAYRACFLARSARWQRWVGWVVATAGLLLVAILFWGNSEAQVGLFAAAAGCSQFPRLYFEARRARSKVAGAITVALVKIAECNPRPELHRLIPELRAAAQDRLQCDEATRAASRMAAERIEALTKGFHDLPVAASAPAPNLGSLPFPAEAPETRGPRSASIDS